MAWIKHQRASPCSTEVDQPTPWNRPCLVYLYSYFKRVILKRVTKNKKKAKEALIFTITKMEPFILREFAYIFTSPEMETFILREFTSNPL